MTRLQYLAPKQVRENPNSQWPKQIDRLNFNYKPVLKLEIFSFFRCTFLSNIKNEKFISYRTALKSFIYKIQLQLSKTRTYGCTNFCTKSLVFFVSLTFLLTLHLQGSGLKRKEHPPAKKARDTCINRFIFLACFKIKA